MIQLVKKKKEKDLDKKITMEHSVIQGHFVHYDHIK